MTEDSNGENDVECKLTFAHQQKNAVAIDFLYCRICSNPAPVKCKRKDLITFSDHHASDLTVSVQCVFSGSIEKEITLQQEVRKMNVHALSTWG